MTKTSDESERLVGAWRLIDFSGDEYAMRTRGKNSTGMVIYDRTGVMSLQIMPDLILRSPFKLKEPSAEEAKNAFTGYQAYFGRYSVDTNAKTVTHHLEGNLDPGQIDNRTRTYEFIEPDRLVLRINSRTLTWQRVG